MKRNAAARAGDVLVLGKPLGVGILGSAMKKGVLDADGYAQMIAATTRLNKVGPALAALPGVHALTDVTGFGLLGHLVEMADGSGLTARVRYDAVPRLASGWTSAPRRPWQPARWRRVTSPSMAARPAWLLPTMNTWVLLPWWWC